MLIAHVNSCVRGGCHVRGVGVGSDGCKIGLVNGDSHVRGVGVGSDGCKIGLVTLVNGDSHVSDGYEI